jgi:MFS family permease
MTDAALDSHKARIIAFFLLAFAAGGVIQPFLNLYLVEVGFSGAQVGVLLGYTSFAIVLVTPLLGWLADRTQRHRLI